MSDIKEWRDVIDKLELDTSKNCGWFYSKRGFLLGDRFITVADSERIVVDPDYLPFVPYFNEEGDLGNWIDTYAEQDEYVKALVVMSILPAVYKHRESIVINLYGTNPNALDIVLNTFGIPSRLRISGTLQDIVDKTLHLRHIPLPVRGKFYYDDVSSLCKMNHRRNRMFFLIGKEPINMKMYKVLNVFMQPVENNFLSKGVLAEPLIRELIRLNVLKKADEMVKDLDKKDKYETFFKEHLVLCHDVLKKITGIEEPLPKPLRQLFETDINWINYYLNLHRANTLIEKRRPTKRLTGYVEPIVEPRGPILIHYETERKILYINEEHFLEFCKSKNLNVPALLNPYFSEGSLSGAYKYTVNFHLNMHVKAFTFDTTKMSDFDEEAFIAGRLSQ